MLGRAVKMAFWVCNDHAGKLILANLLWAIALCVPVLLGLSALSSSNPALALYVAAPLLLLGLGVGLPVASAGLAHMAAVLIEKKDGSLGDFFSGIRRFGTRAIGVAILYGFASACLLSSAWFYAKHLGASRPLLGYTISALALWVWLFVMLSGLFAAPALVQKKEGVWGTIRIAGLLVLDNPLFSIGLSLQCLALAVVSVLVPPVLLFFSGSVFIVLCSSAYELLARKYAKASIESVPAPNGPSHVGPVTTGHRAPIEDEDDDYLNRGFRDFLFPWKS